MRNLLVSLVLVLFAASAASAQSLDFCFVQSADGTTAYSACPPGENTGVVTSKKVRVGWGISNFSPRVVELWVDGHFETAVRPYRAQSLDQRVLNWNTADETNREPHDLQLCGTDAWGTEICSEPLTLYLDR